MKILITGANGLLGQHLVKRLLEKPYQVIATGKGDCRLPFEETEGFRYYPLDITLESQVHDVLEKERPDVVVHAAAITQVDTCELNAAQCEAVNVQGTSHVLVNAESFSAHFIYVSTDFVFDGEQGMYNEDDELRPVNFYGFTKMQAESLTETSEIPFTIIRTCLVYGNVLNGTRNNILTWVKESLENNKVIRVVNDQWRTPTYVEDLAKGIELVIEKKATGTFHISGNEWLSPYAMACGVADQFGFDKKRIVEVSAGTFSQPGKRPPKTGFVIDKAVRELGFQPISFEEGLKKTFRVKS
ncbi:MAG: sugar nucleotide-binding protein [Terrimonas sp.]|nr:sugar nucleotide-binding protein [Terrimonas sp.]